METKYLTIIFLMAFVTYASRMLPLQVSTDYWPGWFKSIIEYVPVSIISTMVLAPLVIKEQNFVTEFGPEHGAAFIVICIAYLTKNLILSIFIGFASYMAFSHLNF